MLFQKSNVALAGFLLAMLSLSFPSSSNAQQWAQWRGEGRKNLSAETGLFENWGNAGPKSIWTAKGLGSGYATVTVADGKIFTSGNTEDAQQVTAYSLDGKQLWVSPITSKLPKHQYMGSRTTPTWHDGKLYVVGSSGNICCLDAETGKQVWSRKFDEWNGKMMSIWGFSESPLVDGDLVVCTPGGPDGMVVALDRLTGKEAWVCKIPDYGDEYGVNGKSLMDGAGYSSIVISEGGGVKQYVQLVGRGLIGVRASDGKLLWRYTKVANGTANIPTPIVDGDYIFTSTSYNTGSALLELVPDGDGVRVKEKYWLDSRTFQNKLGGMTLVDGHIYCGHGNGSGLPICLEMMTGKVKWGPLRAEGKGESSLIYADNHLVWRRQDGMVILTKVNSTEMEVVGTFMPEYQEDNSWAQPVICDGVMYLREQDKLMAFQLK
jgi:outer membrane protein assembly factor BamB